MDLLKRFVLDGTSHEVAIVMREGKPLFRASSIGDVLELKNVRDAIKGFDSSQRSVVPTDTGFGTKDVTYLTREGVYYLVMRSNKPIATPFKRWLIDVITSIEDTGKYVLQEEIDRLKAQSEQMESQRQALADEADGLTLLRDMYRADAERQRGEDLADAYGGSVVVYVGKIVDFPDGRCIIKIGSSSDIRARSKFTRQKYDGRYDLLQCYKVAEERRFQFERHLQGHPHMLPLRYTGDILPGKRSTEAFLVTPEELTKLFNIAERSVSKFRVETESVVLREMDALRGEFRSLREQIAPSAAAAAPVAPAATATPMEEGASDVESEEDEGDGDEDVVIRRGVNPCLLRGRKIQQYSADGKQLLKTYPRMVDAYRDPEFAGRGTFSKHGVSDAARDQTLYKGRRWFFVPSGTDPSRAFDIGDTADKKAFQFTAIAKLSEDETRIEEAFASRGDVAKATGYNGAAWVIRCIQQGRLIKGRKFVSIDDVSSEMLDDFIRRGGRVPSHKDNCTKSIAVNMLHPLTREVLRTFDTFGEIQIKYKIGRNALLKAVNNGSIVRDHMWAFA